MVPLAQDKFNSDGQLIDPKTKEKIIELLHSLVVWSRKLNKE